MKKQKFDHPHAEFCSDFNDALKSGYLFLQNGEIQMLQNVSNLPKQEQIKISNILTNEEFNKEEFLMGMIIRFCPFCSQKLEKIESESPLSDLNPFNDPNPFSEKDSIL